MANFDITLLGELQSLWSSKNWKFPTPEDYDFAFNKLCEMFSLLSLPQQQLALKLTRVYSRYSFTDYQSLLIRAFASINNVDIKNADQVILAPLINPGDDVSKKSKSGHGLLYIAEHVAIPCHHKLKGMKVVCLASPDAIPKHLSEQKRSLIILLDDFIGSGDTAKAAVQHWQNKVSAQDTILVVCLVAMNHAIRRLATYKINVVYADLVYKGIDENSSITDKANAYQLIDNAESLLDINKDCRRGYNKSEALITMIRTPDNTFPIYWCSKQSNGSIWPAPFPR